MTWFWRKLGLLYFPCKRKRHPKLATHAANPLPIHLEGDIYRIFYSGRDLGNRSSVGAVDIDIIQKKIVEDHFAPFFEYGPKESFFADGVSIGNSYAIANQRYILFMGWQNPKGAHWRGDIGRLILDSDHNLSLAGKRPFMTTDMIDPISLSYPWVQKVAENSFEMWYGSTKTWDGGNGEMVHTINFSISTDGHRWQKLGTALPYHLGVAQAFSRPTILPSAQGTLEMWFSYRSGLGTTYRIGYAKKKKAENWRLHLNEQGIDVSANGWDSEMVEYPFVFEHKKEVYMLYNGNQFGKTGFGIARRETKNNLPK